MIKACEIILTYRIFKILFLFRDESKIFQFFRLYSGMWRYVSIYDLVQIFLANLISSIILFIVVMTWHQGYFAGFSRSVLVLDFLICFFAISGKRVLVRVIREASEKSREQKTLLNGFTLNILRCMTSVTIFTSFGSGCFIPARSPIWRVKSMRMTDKA